MENEIELVQLGTFTNSPDPKLEVLKRHELEAAQKLRAMLEQSGGEKTPEFCETVYRFRIQRGMDALPIDQMPCATCPKRQ